MERSEQEISDRLESLAEAWDSGAKYMASLVAEGAGDELSSVASRNPYRLRRMNDAGSGT